MTSPTRISDRRCISQMSRRSSLELQRMGCFHSNHQTSELNGQINATVIEPDVIRAWKARCINSQVSTEGPEHTDSLWSVILDKDNCEQGQNPQTDCGVRYGTKLLRTGSEYTDILWCLIWDKDTVNRFRIHRQTVA
ncbi:hypothetical protein RRG08_056855 [Elysia crispata]|uniref:Uncharacterized protein n=1 Tax=Elysia crispata TaxID=231223 RepID=A0AAE1ACB0_9GAST|nr:hypothetical protein RRG08_056855 [Elysia crispata]